MLGTGPRNKAQKIEIDTDYQLDDILINMFCIYSHSFLGGTVDICSKKGGNYA